MNLLTTTFAVSSRAASRLPCPSGLCQVVTSLVALLLPVGAIAATPAWQPLGKNSAGAQVSLDTSSIITGGTVQKASLLFEKVIKGRPLSIVIQTEFKCASRQYKLARWMGDDPRNVADAADFRAMMWKSWSGPSVITSAAAIVCAR